MASTYVNNLRLNEMATGDQSGTWGTTTNTNLELIGQALGWGTRAIANASTDNITIADGASDADRSMALKLTGGGQACTVTILPNTSSKVWVMENATAATLTFTQGSGANVAILAGETKMIATDGLGSGAVVYDVLTDLNLAGTTKVAGLSVAGLTSIATNQKVQFRDNAIYLNSSADGQLDIVADTEIQIAATTVDINGAVDLSADLTVGDDLTVNGGVIELRTDSGSVGQLKLYCETSNNHAQTLSPQAHSVAATNTLTLPGGSTIGNSNATLVSDTGTQTLTNKSLTAPTITGTAVMATLDISGDVDVDGTTNLDIVDIDGAVNMATTALVTGVLTTTAATVFNGGFASNDGSTITTDDNSYNLQLISTDADASQGPLLSLHRQSGSPADNDVIGSIQYRFNNDADQAITGHLAIAQIVDASDGTEDCHIIEQLMVAGTMNETVRYTPTETVFNEDSKDRDFRVESDNLTSALFVNGADGVVTAGAAFTATGAITAGGNITRGGTVIGDGSITDTGTFTVDVAGDIILDADGTAVMFKDAGTEFGRIFNSSTDLVIKSIVSDKDMIFQGNDGGSAITALTLDMSDAGAATFNGKITADAGIDIDNFNIDGTTIALSSGDMLLDSAGGIVLDADDSGTVSYKDAGTRFGILQKSGNNFEIHSAISDGDLVFKGTDGGSGITALTIDMSAAGAATFNNDVTAFSDERLKSNITTIPDALSKVTEMRGVHYVRNETGKDSSGVIAQEMQKVAPELVLTAEDEMGTLSVNYGNITGYLIEAIKELKAEIEELKAR